MGGCVGGGGGLGSIRKRLPHADITFNLLMHRGKGVDASICRFFGAGIDPFATSRCQAVLGRFNTAQDKLKGGSLNPLTFPK